MIDYLIFSILGSFAGAIIGLIPGLHCNLFAYLIFLSNDLSMALFLFCALLSSNVFEFLSAAYLNVPKEGEILLKDSFRKFLASGRMNSAVKIIAYSTIITYSIIMVLGAVIGELISNLSLLLSNYSWIILLLVSFFILVGQKRKLMAFSFFMLSGILGIITFDLNLNEPFLPLLTGMFGLSGLIINAKKGSAPNQLEKTAVESSFFELFKTTFIGVIASIAMMLVPAISPSQVGFFAPKYKDDELKVASIASINIADVILSLTTFFYISKARSGVIEKIGQAITIGLNEYYLIMAFGFFALLLSNFIAIKANKKLSDNIELIGSKYFKIAIIIFVLLLTTYFDGLMGFMILFFSTILGIILLKSNIRPVNLMGSLAVPTLLFFILRLF